MKQSGMCPKCGATEIFVVDEARLPNYEYSNSVVPLTLTSHYTTTGETGLLGGPKMGRASVHLAAHVCGRCGAVEWYAKDLDVLRRLASEPDAGVRGPK